MAFEIYVADTETTGLDRNLHDIVELSLYRLSDGSQRTWCLKPSRYENITAEALRINRHKIEDLKHLTQYGKETYRSVAQVLPEVELWMMEDNVSADQRILLGQNPQFDLDFLSTLWKNNNAEASFPFGSRPFILDTRQIAVFLDLAFNEFHEFYNLGSLLAKYGIKNKKAHTAEADVLATKELFEAQCKYVKSKK